MSVEVGGPPAGHTFPVTAAQQHMVTAALLRPEVSHVVAMYVDIVGSLDVPRLQRAVAATGREMVVRRLRVGIVDDVLVQWIMPDDSDSDSVSTGLALPVVDLRATDDPVVAGLTWMARGTAEPADPLEDSAGSDTLLRVGETRWFWYSRFQAHTFDSAGMRTLIERTADLYRSDGVFRAPQPPAVARTLFESDRRYRRSERYEVDRRYWLDVLAGNPDPTSLSTVRAAADPRPLAVERPLNAETRSRIDVLARDSGSTAAGILTAATAAFLAMRTGRERVVVSLPVTGRTAVAARRAPGTVANVLPVAIDVTPTTRLSSLVESVRARMTEALRHQQFRLEDITADADLPPRTMASGPSINLVLFPSTVSFGDVTGTIRVLAEGPVEDLAVDAWTTAAGEITVGFRANPLRYERAELEDLHTTFLRFVDRFVAAELATTVGAIPGVETDDWEVGIRSRRAVPFWTQQFRSPAPLLDLPVDWVPVESLSVESLPGPAAAFEVSAELAAGLARRAEEFETGTTILVMAALLGGLRRFGITGPVPVGLPVDGFVPGAGGNGPQVVVLRPNTPRDTSLADVVTACDRQVRKVFEYAGTRPPADLTSGAPAYRVLVTADHAGAVHPDFPGLDLGPSTATADLVVTWSGAVSDNASGTAPAGASGTAPDGGASGTVSWIGGTRPAAALATAVRAMLRAIVDEPTTLISQVPVLDADQRAALTAAPLAPRPVATLIDLFHRVVALTPDAPAVGASDGELDYRTLFGRVNRLARFLIHHGVGPESVVVVLLPGDTRRIVTTVAVCEAGGAYLPLEPGAGTAELVELINRVRPVCIVTTRRWARHLDDVSFRIIDLDDWEVTRRIEVQSADALALEERYGAIRPDNTAVVCPGPQVKGRRLATPLSHGAVVRMLAASAEVCEFRSSDVWTVVRPPAVLPTAWDIWAALVHGSMIAVPPTSIADDPAAVRRFLADRRVTVLCTTPRILDRITPAESDVPRLVVVSGPVDDQRRNPLSFNGSESPAGMRMLHCAGPVEWDGHAFRRDGGTGSRVVSGRGSRAGSGAGYRPVRGTTAYILDDRLQPVPVGAPGRLYLAGDRLPRNYLRDARATVSRLVANPFAGVGGVDGAGRDDRMLRTDARARWVAPGVLDILPSQDRRRPMIASRSWSGTAVAAADVLGGVAQPGVAQPDVAGPDGGQPDGGQPDSAIPDSAQPDDTGPYDAESFGAQPVPWTDGVPSPAVGRTERMIAMAMAGIPGLESPDPDTDLVAAARDPFTVLVAAQRISTALQHRVRASDLLVHRTTATLADHLVRSGAADPGEGPEQPPGESASGNADDPATDDPATDDPATDDPATDDPATGDADDPATDDSGAETYALSTDLALAALAESAAIDSDHDPAAPIPVLLQAGDGATTPLVIVGEPAEFSPLIGVLAEEIPVVAVPAATDSRSGAADPEPGPADTEATIAHYVRTLRHGYPTEAIRLLGKGDAGAATLGVAAALASVDRSAVDVVLIDPDPIDLADAPVIDGSLTYVTIIDNAAFDPVRSAARWRPLVRGPIIDHRVDVDRSDADPDLAEDAWRAIAEIVGKTDPAR